MSLGEDVPFDEKSFSFFHYRPVLLLWCARVATGLAFQMQAVAVGWQVYELTSSAFDLGMVGLMMFIPAVLLMLVVGQIVDRYDRRAIIRLAQLVMAVTTGCLALGTVTDVIGTSMILAAVFVLGAARAFEMATLQTMAPSIVPPSVLPRTIAGLSSGNQIASVVGPALGGVLLFAGTTAVYVTCCALFILASVLISLIRMQRGTLRRDPVTVEALFAGIHFVRKNPLVLGPMSLDMFAVVFGGATALLPIFARDIFEVGTVGLGLMRAAPAAGALTVAFVVAHWPFHRHLGRIMYGGVAMFGIATIVFGLSTSFVLSLVALFVIGGSDMLSIVVRQPLIQLETPDAMRGRVSAVNSLFVGTSNQIGEFESGLTAAWFGTVPSVLIGGVGTLLIVLLWIKVFPQLYRVDRFEKRYK